MAIQEQILHSVDAVERHFNAGDYIFREGDTPRFYYQILTGEVKVCRFIDGQEFVQDILSKNSSIGESMLIVGKPYPFNSVVLSKCTVLQVSIDQFFHLLKLHPQIFEDIYKTLADDTFEKVTLMDTLTNKNKE